MIVSLRILLSEGSHVNIPFNGRLDSVDTAKGVWWAGSGKCRESVGVREEVDIDVKEEVDVG